MYSCNNQLTKVKNLRATDILKKINTLNDY